MLTLETVGKNLKITLTAEARKAIDDGELDMGNDPMLTLLEHHLCNGWENLSPEDIGVLTSCPLILSEEVERNDQGKIKKVGKLFWHERYQIEDAFEVLKEKGELILQCGD